MWNETEYEGHYFGDLPVGGYRRLAEAMAIGVDLRLGVDVTEVACSASGVRVRSVDGASEEGSHVVVTVPLGVLKRDVLRFRPALPPDRLMAIERLGFGRYEKVALQSGRRLAPRVGPALGEQSLDSGHGACRFVSP
jgi:polyamine oxidase